MSHLHGTIFSNKYVGKHLKMLPNSSKSCLHKELFLRIQTKLPVASQLVLEFRIYLTFGTLMICS